MDLDIAQLLFTLTDDELAAVLLRMTGLEFAFRIQTGT